MLPNPELWIGEMSPASPSLPYPHHVPRLIATGAQLHQIWTELATWVEPIYSGVVYTFLSPAPAYQRATSGQIPGLAPDQIEALDRLGWQYLQAQATLGEQQSLSLHPIVSSLDPDGSYSDALEAHWIPLVSPEEELLGMMGLYSRFGPVGLASTPEILWVQDLACLALQQRHQQSQMQQVCRERDQYQAILDNAPMGVVIKDLHHRYVQVNQYKEQTSQTPRHQIIGKTEYDFFSPEIAATLQANDQQVLDQGKPQQIEETTRIANGEIRHCLSIKFPLRDPLDQHITGLGGLFIDITEKKHREAQLYILQKAIEACGNGVVITDALDPDYPVIYVNPAFEQITGYDATEILGKNCRLLQGPDRDQPECEQIRRGLREQRSCRVTLRNYRKDGSLFWNELYLSPIWDGDGRLTHYVGIQTDVTQQKQAEEKLRLSEARLRTFIDNLPFCAWARDTDLRLVIQNEANRKLYGNPIGSRPEESSLPPYRVARWETLMRRALEEVVIQAESTEMIQGELHYFHRITMAIPEAQSGIKFIGIGIDITQQKRMKEEIDRFFRVSLDLFCITSKDGYFRRTNSSWKTILGYEHHELEGYCLLDRVHPEDLPATQKVMEQLQRGEAILNFVNRYRSADGTYRCIEWHGYPYGELIYWAARDITERQQAEMVLRQNEKDLLHRIKFESLLTQISTDFITHTWDQLDEGIQQALERVLEFLELDRAYLYLSDADRGAKLAYYQCCPGISADLPPYFSEAQLATYPWSTEQLHQGQSLWISHIEQIPPEAVTDRQRMCETGRYSFALLPLHRGQQLLGVLGLDSVRQVRQWSPQERSLLTNFSQILVNALERKGLEQRQKEFIAIVSHELRTPLTSIRALLGLLSAGRLGSLQPRGQALLESAISDADRLERLVNEILDLDYLKSGRVQLQPQPCQVRQVLDQLMQALHPLASPSQIEIFTTCDVDQAWADPDRLLQVLTNLVGNAIKFSPSPSQIQIRVIEQRDHTLWQVQDQGPGIPTDQLKSIFDPFVQVNSSDSRPKSGTGLGLAICRQIIRHHRGQIWVEVSPQGSTFCFTLPHQPLNTGRPTSQLARPVSLTPLSNPD